MSRSSRDRLLAGLTATAALLSGAIVVLVTAFVAGESLPALRAIGVARFFTDPSWHPSSGRFNLAPMLLASLFAAGGALLLALPLGVAMAVFLHAYGPPGVARVVRTLIELLAAVPSVVYGFFGLVTLVPWLVQLHPPGASLLAAILILALMVLPTVTLLAEAALVAVPRAQVATAAALGFGRATTLWCVVLPAARRGVRSAGLVAMGRALGETMAVLMVCGNVVQWPTNLWKPVRPLTANIALEMAYALGTHRSALFVSGLVLLAAVAVLVVAGHARPRLTGA